ncbi:Energy-coupling factor transporter transmembrane protein EcfT [Methanimicrococcus stummii]|uniref:Energy-coupling factor transporter transmembrane protein EcfT n=1 Tax=Methanimicrococcus stummii TaxID=3028294 RepID=A0AA96ZXG8_9EURY|nr:CbiQ family ECF transporter T component [Methanimicrococcus sp. Es2]WNY29000.1 Energy-coupling factor transporter transmembrane protein EcfT [Methanimicrococcus sp. Es2]
MYKQFLSYVSGNSFLHKLDPRTKIITLMILSIIIFNINRIWSLLSLLALFAIVALVARIPIKKLVLSVKPLLFFIVVVFLLHFLFAPTPVFSDISLSVKIMDDQINNLDPQYMFAAKELEHEVQFYQLQYFEGFYEYPPADFHNNGDYHYLILSGPPPNGSFDVEGPARFEVGSFRIERIPYDQIPEDHFNKHYFEPIPADDPNRRVHLSKPAIYEIKVTPETSFSIYPSMYSFMTGLGVALKFILLILFASLMAATTKQSALIQGIERMVRPIPLKWANITSQDLALMVLLTIRFIPLLTSTSSQIKVSAQSRAFNPGKHPFRSIKIVSTSLINSIIDFADDVSKAMINRGYTGIGKTSMSELKMTRKDGVFFCAFLFVMFFIIVSVGWMQISLGTHI